MFISDLKLHGFKSFAQKENLSFGEGITAVVGPNGCGKTNIVDAIRWVLGEQKYSILRSSRMEDIIFNGADGIKPLGVCEVSLTVHNNKGKLPIEYNDVEISRRIFRNGESEYTLNRTPCRLKDIHNLFVDTGMGADAYSVIELKMIEQILSDTAEDRKRMFEEAAGINKYKSQRKSAIRKFEATKLDLDRINDIAIEVQTKVQGLNLQLKRFKRHENLVLKLKENEISLAYLEVKSFEESLGPLNKKIQEFKLVRESNKTKENIHDVKLNRLRDEYNNQDKELISFQNELNSLKEMLDKTNQNVLIATEQKKSTIETVVRINHEYKNNESKNEQLLSQLKEIEKELESFSPMLEEKLGEYNQKKQNFEQVEGKYKKSQIEVENLQTNRWKKQRKLSGDESLIHRTDSLIIEKNEYVKNIQIKIKILEKNQNKISRDREKIGKDKTDIQNKLNISNSELSKHSSALLRLKEEQGDLNQKYHVSKTQVESLKSQLQFYTELVHKGEGFPVGSKYILERKNDFPEIYGTVADIFQVDEKYQAAIENALGNAALCLVSKNKKAALSILETMRNKKVGSVTMFPLEELSKIKSNFKKIPNNKNIIGRGSDFVDSVRKFQPIADFLLGNLLIVKNLKNTLKNDDLPGWNVVDIHGDYMGNNNIVRSSGSSKKNVIGRQQKIEQLQKDIDVFKIESEKFQRKVLSIENSINDYDKKIKIVTHENSNLDQELISIDHKWIENQFIQSRNKESIQNAGNELQETKSTIDQLSKSLKILNSKIKKEHEALDSLQVTLDTFTKNLESESVERDTFLRKVQDIRIELLNLENKRENFLNQKKSIVGIVSELEVRNKEIKSEILLLEDKIEILISQIDQGEKEHISINGKLNHKRSVLELKRQVYSDTYEQIESIEREIRTEQQNRESVLDNMKQCELDSVEIKQQIQNIEERIQDKYQEDIHTEIHVEKNKETLGLDIERINQSIERIGPVNMAVQLEFNEENNRLELLNEQRDDLIKAEENLRNTIHKIDSVARKQFQDTFDQIKTNFENLFVLFFEGGQATLELRGDPDPLEAEISILAQPPGKRNQSLRMLSAGEKSLTAIALLFSIYQYKPSPFCILDEVDAPLDDMNIQKFTRVLKQFSEETQFIIVTHNKLTMEAANYMYGVTMEKKGVSKLVSVKFAN